MIWLDQEGSNEAPIMVPGVYNALVGPVAPTVFPRNLNSIEV